MTTNQTQLSASNAGVLAASLNVAFVNGPLRINGETVVSKGGDAITRHANGSLSYRTAEHPNKRTYLKVGHMLVVGEGDETSTPEPVAETPAPEAKPKRARQDGKVTIEATVKGETGYLVVNRTSGHLTYGVTMDERRASRFLPGTGSMERHIQRATAGGIFIDQSRIAA